MPLRPGWQLDASAGGLPTDPLWWSSPEYLRASAPPDTSQATQSPRPVCKRARPGSFHELPHAELLCRWHHGFFYRLPQVSICQLFWATASQNRPPYIGGIRLKLQPLDLPGQTSMRCHAMGPSDQEPGSGCFSRSHAAEVGLSRPNRASPNPTHERPATWPGRASPDWSRKNSHIRL